MAQAQHGTTGTAPGEQRERQERERQQRQRQEWERWRAERTAEVSAPYGLTALRSTHWLSDYPDGRLPAIPGEWILPPEGGAPVLRAAAGDGLIVDEAPFAGELRLGPDSGPPAAARVALGRRRLVVLAREGAWAVRDFDPASPARAAFRGIATGAFDPDLAVPGRFTPYGTGRTVRVAHADGRERGLGLGGELAFELAGQRRTLRVAVLGDGSLWAVFADATSGRGSYRFRFLDTAAPGPDGAAVVDFNRARLPSCAFADAFLCPFPPPGNTLDVPVEAGELRLLPSG
ncbi:hypothetical protein SLNWT_6142 [Streptomyces albus]|uniref:DUF1684 domain-containing protein n=1 Tax=Streptomyces albus (strain ATCC 21838 / DSM 41398 / FERM P-419 / JCM 4703 / NBRC 107858) TaxID=1081613 RepID=A0A0B5EUJ5_STRA4|nr:hypothetical protein SLNWT_6142 [Streptomyces albus]AOU80822.1 hypothetical protein SLNHY_6131 [Streptomyces albus]AYN36527.1 DUF1684 domain-containing protein [Streptomyces albus]